jgi:hypothetical protein
LIKFEDSNFSLDVNVSPNEECDNSVRAIFAHTALDDKTYNVAYYYLDVIISLDYVHRTSAPPIVL